MAAQRRNAIYVGGWGYEISDEGSGAAIGRELLRRCIWAHDGRIPRDAALRCGLAEFNNDPEVLVDWVGKARPSRLRDAMRRSSCEHAGRRDPLGVAIDASRPPQDWARSRTRLLDLGAPAICLFGGLAEPLRPWLSPPVQRHHHALPWRMRWTAPSFWPAIALQGRQP